MISNSEACIWSPTQPEIKVCKTQLSRTQAGPGRTDKEVLRSNLRPRRVSRPFRPSTPRSISWPLATIHYFGLCKNFRHFDIFRPVVVTVPLSQNQTQNLPRRRSRVHVARIYPHRPSHSSSVIITKLTDDDAAVAVVAWHFVMSKWGIGIMERRRMRTFRKRRRNAPKRVH